MNTILDVNIQTWDSQAFGTSKLSVLVRPYNRRLNRSVELWINIVGKNAKYAAELYSSDILA